MRSVRRPAQLAVVLLVLLIATQLVYPQVPDSWTIPMTALTVLL